MPTDSGVESGLSAASLSVGFGDCTKSVIPLVSKPGNMVEHSVWESDRLTRRTVLAGTAVGGIGVLAGCLGEENGDTDAPDPITIEDGQRCDHCTMAITDYPGPVGQAFYDEPAELLEGDEDRPAQFCSALCTYTFSFENESTAEPIAVYLTDYSSVDYDVDDSDEPEITSHEEAEAFAPAEDLLQVADSEVYGAMGGALVGFSNDDDATAFVDAHGGETYAHEDVDSELIMSLMN